jgi:hypothetical protein
MGNILYLNALESTASNNLHKNQVLSLKETFTGPTFKVLFLSPLLILSKKKIGLNKNKFGKEADEIKIPLASYNHYLSWFVIPYFLLISVAALLFYIKKNKYRPAVIHTRGYPATLTAYYYKRFFDKKVQILFDPRSVYPEEGVIIGRWSYNSVSFNTWKRLEKKLSRESAAIFALSMGMQEYFSAFNPKVYFLPAIVDTRKFNFSASVRNKYRQELGIKDDEILLIYSGSIGLWHNEENLFKAVSELLDAMKERTFRLYILTGQQVSTKPYSALSNLTETKVFSVPGKEMPGYLNAADIGILPGSDITGPAYELLYKTMISSKVQEYLSVGLKVIISNRISEVADLAFQKNIGFIFENKSGKYVNDLQEPVLPDEKRSSLSLELGESYSLEKIANGYYSEYKKYI